MRSERCAKRGWVERVVYGYNERIDMMCGYDAWRRCVDSVDSMPGVGGRGGVDGPLPLLWQRPWLVVVVAVVVVAIRGGEGACSHQGGYTPRLLALALVLALVSVLPQEHPETPCLAPPWGPHLHPLEWEGTRDDEDDDAVVVEVVVGIVAVGVVVVDTAFVDRTVTAVVDVVVVVVAAAIVPLVCLGSFSSQHDGSIVLSSATLPWPPYLARALARPGLALVPLPTEIRWIHHGHPHWKNAHPHQWSHVPPRGGCHGCWCDDWR